jgi:hypothetical protein
MFQDVRWRACHLQAKARPRAGPGLDILGRKSAPRLPSGPAAHVLHEYSTWLTRYPLTSAFATAEGKWQTRGGPDEVVKYWGHIRVGTLALQHAVAGEDRVSETRVGDQSADEATPQCSEHARRLLRAGRHADYCRYAPKVIKIHREDSVVDRPTNCPTGGVEEAAARIANGILRQEGAALGRRETQTFDYLQRRARAEGSDPDKCDIGRPSTCHNMTDRRLGEQCVACRLRVQQGWSVEVPTGRRTEPDRQVTHEFLTRCQ